MFKTIGLYICSFFEKSKNKFFDGVTSIISVILILLTSGFGYIQYGLSSKAKIFLYAAVIVYFCVLAIFKIKISTIKNIFKNKQIPIPKISTIMFMIMMLLLVLSFVFNGDKTSNLNTYISFGVTLLITFIVLKVYDMKTILNAFKNVMFVLSIIGIVIFLFTYVARWYYSSIYFSNNNAIFGSHFFLSTDFVTGTSGSYLWIIRLSSVFWEPSVMGIMLIMALLANVLVKDKISLLKSVIYLVAIFLTSSTGAFILLPFVFLFWLFKTLKGRKLHISVFLTVVVLIVCLIFYKEILLVLAKIFPSVAGKLINQATGEVVLGSTRFLSFGIYFESFLKSPIFGLGGHSSIIAYKELGSLMAVDAGTSTAGYILSSFGILGFIYVISIVIGILFNKKMNVLMRTVFLLIFVLGSNLQNQSEIIVLNIFYFASLFMIEEPEKATKHNARIAQKSEDNTTIKDYIFSKNESGTVSKNILFSMVLKGVAILLAFVTIPVYLQYFDSDNSVYGIWLTITSILSIITVFDFGMGNSMKNSLIKNIENGDSRESKTIVSTVYVLTGVVGFAIFVLGVILIFSLSDTTIQSFFFRETTIGADNLLTFRIAVSVIVLGIGLQFMLKNINYVLQAHQRNAITGLFMLITNIALLLFALLFKNIIPPQNRIIVLAIAYCIFLNTPLLLASLVLFFGKYRSFRPRLKYVNFKKTKAVVSIGLKFFAVQIGTLFLWSINEFIILGFFGQSSMVTTYLEYYKLFSIMPVILGTVIQQPIWTALTKAEIEKNTKSISNYIKIIFVIAGVFAFINTVLTFALPFAFDIWLGSNAPQVTLLAQIAFLLYSYAHIAVLAIVIVCNSFSLFKGQIITAFFSVFAKIPLMYLIMHLSAVFGFSIDWTLVIFINILFYIPTIVISPFEIRKRTKKLFNGGMENISRKNLRI